MSWPAIRAEPSLGGRKPVSMRIVVVLPAPLGPRKPTTSPRLDPERDIVDGDDVSVALGEMGGLDHAAGCLADRARGASGDGSESAFGRCGLDRCRFSRAPGPRRGVLYEPHTALQRRDRPAPAALTAEAHEGILLRRMGFPLSGPRASLGRTRPARALAALAALWFVGLTTSGARAVDVPGSAPDARTASFAQRAAGERRAADWAGRFCTTACRPGAGLSSGLGFAAGVVATALVARRRG